MSSTEQVREWVGGRLTLPARIEPMGDRRAEMSLWVELPGLQVVGHVIETARELGAPVAVVAGDADPGALPDDVPSRTLVELSGSPEVARRDAAALAAAAAEALVTRR